MKILQYLLVLILSSRSSANSCGFLYPSDLSGYCIKSTECPGASFENNCESDATRCCVLETTLSFPVPSSNFSQKQFLGIFGQTTRNVGLYDYFLAGIAQGGIKTCHQQAAFAAQVAFDTNYLMDMAERIDEKTASPEDVKYKGRGGIQIHGKRFYDWLNSHTMINVLGRQDALMFPSMAFIVAAQTWIRGYSQENTDPVDYNALADGSEYNFVLMSGYLHGNVNQIQDRLKVWRNAISVLQCNCDVPVDGGQCKVNGQIGACRMISDCHGRHVEALDQCRGPSSIFQCCLDCNGKFDVGLVFDTRSTTSVMKMPGLNNFINDLISHFKISTSQTQFTTGIYTNKSDLEQIQRFSNKNSVETSIAQLIQRNMTFETKTKSLNVNLASLYKYIFPKKEIAHIHGERSRKLMLFLTKFDFSSNVILSDKDKIDIEKDSGFAIALNMGQSFNSKYSSKDDLWNISLSKENVNKISKDVCSVSQVIDDVIEIETTLTASEKQYFKFTTLRQYIKVVVIEGDVYINKSVKVIGQHTSCRSGFSDESTTIETSTKENGCYIIKLQSEIPQKYDVKLVITGKENHNTIIIQTTDSPKHNEGKDGLSSVIFIFSITTMAVCTFILIVFIISQCHYAYKTNYQKSRTSSDCEGSISEGIYCSRKISNSSRRGLMDNEEVKVPVEAVNIYLTMLPFFSYFMLIAKGQFMAPIKKYRNHRFWYDIQCSKILSIMVYLFAHLFVVQSNMSKAECLPSMILTGYAGLSMLLWMIVEFWHLYGGIKHAKTPIFRSKTLAYFVAWGAPIPIVGISVFLAFENKHMSISCWRNLNIWNYWLFGSIEIILILVATCSCILVLKNKTVLKDCKHPSKLSRFNSKIVSAAIFFVACLILGISTELSTLCNVTRVFKILLVAAYLWMIVVIIFIYIILLTEVKETFSMICEKLGLNCCFPIGSSFPVVSIHTQLYSHSDKDTLDVLAQPAIFKPSLIRHKSLSSGDLPWTTREITRDDINKNVIKEHNNIDSNEKITPNEKTKDSRKITIESLV